MVDKHPLVPDRIRRPPATGWWWVDRRFFWEFAPKLSRDAILLYSFLASIGDKHGVSFFHDATIAAHTRMAVESVSAAREELVALDLVAHRHPLTQMLSLPEPILRRGRPEPELLGDLLRRLADDGGGS